MSTHREQFIKTLTVDSESQDRRRRGFNQAIFDPNDGLAVWTSTDLDMVLLAYDNATKRLEKR